MPAKRKADIVLSVVYVVFGIAFIGYAVKLGITPISTWIDGPTDIQHLIYHCGSTFSPSIPTFQEFQDNTYAEMICSRLMSNRSTWVYSWLGAGLFLLIFGVYSLFHMRPKIIRTKNNGS